MPVIQEDIWRACWPKPSSVILIYIFNVVFVALEIKTGANLFVLGILSVKLIDPSHNEVHKLCGSL